MKKNSLLYRLRRAIWPAQLLPPPAPGADELRVLVVADPHKDILEALGISDERADVIYEQAHNAIQSVAKEKKGHICVAEAAARVTGLHHANEVLLLGCLLASMQEKMVRANFQVIKLS